MLDVVDARAAALASTKLREGMTLGEARELNEGWYFPFESQSQVIGSNGVIVNKRSGRLLHLGSAFPAERDLALYDRGYQFELYDLEITAVHDRAETLRALRELRLKGIEQEEAHGVVWEIPRELTNAELSRKLEQRPCNFDGVKLYFVIEVLEEARRAGWFTFEVREHVPPPSPKSAS